MAQISFMRGKSVTLTLVLNSEYDPTNIEDIIVKLRKEVVAQLTTSTLLTTSNPRVFRVVLSSEFTNSLNSLSKLQISLDDSSLGVFQFELIDVYANASLGFSNTSVNEGSDFTLNLTINPDSTVVDIETVTIYNSFNQGQLDEMSDYADAASASASTATTQAGVATTQAGIATTQAEIATTKAMAAATSATNAANSASTAASTLASKANIASPTFTGTVIIPTLSVTNDATINGKRIGVGVLTGSNNFIAGVGNLTSVGSGSDNTSIGDYSQEQAVGTYNTSVGRSSLAKIGGNYNTGIGGISGRYISDGATALTNSNHSIFIGYQSMALADNQSNQIVIGSQSVGLGSNTTVVGRTSTVFGRWWGNLLLGSSTNSGEMLQVTGTTKLAGNTAVTGTLTTSGTINGITVGSGITNTNNTAFGFNVLSTANAGNNTGFGTYALQNYTGIGSAAMGRSSLSALVSGDGNTAIGDVSGRYIANKSGAVTISSQSVFLGAISGPNSDNETNQIVIGYNSTGRGSHTTTIGNSSTTLTYLFGQVAGGSFKLHALNTAPASATATGIAGEIRVTADFIYICTATNVWKRSALTTW